MSSKQRLKGIILAGGFGTRLHPLTAITNKHLLPVYDEPMVLYPLRTLQRAGVRDVIIVCGQEHAKHFTSFLGSGAGYGVTLSYAHQKGAGGIAEALGLTKKFVGKHNAAVILGDNIFQDNFSDAFSQFARGEGGARVFLKRVPDPKRFGVPVFDRSKRIVRVDEKPQRPRSRYAVTGLYLYSPDVFTKITTLKPSARGELEISDIQNQYIAERRLSHSYVKGFWSDAGTFPSLLHASQWAARQKKN